MIVRITGKLVQVDKETAVLDRDGIFYELHLPTFAAASLADRIGQDVTLHTIHYVEGTAVGANQYPRLIGFPEVMDRAFFLEFVKVKGMGMRRALRAFARPASWIAGAVEQGDVKLLTTLPELGKRTAEQLIASLKGKLDQFAYPAQTEPAEEFTQAQKEALEILLQLGERRSEAVAFVQQVSKDKRSTDPAKIVEDVYRLKSGQI